MSWLTKLFGGGASGGISGAVTAVAKTADTMHYSAQEKSTDEASDMSEARAQSPTYTHNTWFDVVIDGWSRAIRPGVTTWLFGGWANWWKLPDTQTLDPFWTQLTLVIVSFWFGGRVLIRDLPQLVATITKVLRK